MSSLTLDLTIQANHNKLVCLNRHRLGMIVDI